MSAIWGGEATPEPLAWQRRMFRIWGYVAVGGTFLMFVYIHLGLSF